MNRVLIVEDDRGVRRVMEVALRFTHEIESASNGRDALVAYHEARAGGNPFHALLLDVNLEGALSGYDVAGAVRLRGDNETKIIFLSALDGEEGPRLAVALNATWLRKPEDISRIEELLTTESVPYSQAAQAE